MVRVVGVFGFVVLGSLACGGVTERVDVVDGVEAVGAEPIAAPNVASSDGPPSKPTATSGRFAPLKPLLAYGSLDALREKFGSDVSVVKVFENEVGDVEYSALYAGTEKEVVYQFPQVVMIRHPKSPWRTPAGVMMGMTLAELQALHGKPFSMGLTPEGMQASFDDESPLSDGSVYLRPEDPKADVDDMQSDADGASALKLRVTELYVSLD